MKAPRDSDFPFGAFLLCDKKVIPGAVVMVMRNGKVAYYEAIGYQDGETNIQ